MKPETKYIAIEGNIGAGKTTLSKRLAADLDARLILEQFEDNSFLPKFYKAQERNAFPLETSFLVSRFNQLKELLNTRDMFAGNTIADYGIFKSLVFARINLDDDEFSLFMRIFGIIENQIPVPDLIVYLYQPVDVLMRNIQKRGRQYELQIEPSYLEKIHQSYLAYFRSLSNQSVLMVNADTLDFEDRPQDYEYLRRLIFDKHEPGITQLP